MTTEIKEIGVESLPCYAEIPIAFKVETMSHVETIITGLEDSPLLRCYIAK